MGPRIAVVGAGVTGLSTAFALAAGGAAVRVYDGGGIGSGASAIQPGGVRQQWGSRVNCQMARYSYHCYCDLSAYLGVPVQATLEPCGYLFVAQSEDTYNQLRRNCALQNEIGVPSVLVTAAEAAELVPGLDPSTLVGATFCAEDGYFDRPQAVVAALAEAAVQAGAEIIPTHVRSLLRNGDGWSLLFADATEAHVDCVVVAAGYDSEHIVADMGISLPIKKEARHLFYSDPIRERLLEPLVVSAEQHFAAKQLADGCVLASDLSAVGLSEEAILRWRYRIRESIEILLPRLTYVTFPVHVEGFYDMTPDSQALLGEMPDLEGLWIAAGFSGHGFMMAPAVGRFLADAILRGETDEVVGALSPSRFDEDNIVPEPQVV